MTFCFENNSGTSKQFHHFSIGTLSSVVMIPGGQFAVAFSIAEISVYCLTFPLGDLLKSRNASSIQLLFSLLDLIQLLFELTSFQ
jgi:hypothetical protein